MGEVERYRQAYSFEQSLLSHESARSHHEHQPHDEVNHRLTRGGKVGRSDARGHADEQTAQQRTQQGTHAPDHDGDKGRHEQAVSHRRLQAKLTRRQNARHACKHDADDKVRGAQQVNVHAKRRYGFEIGIAGANADAQSGVAQHGEQHGSAHQGNRDNKEAVAGEKEVGLTEGMSQRFRDGQRHAVGTPDGADHVLHDQRQTEGEQQRIQRIAFVQAANEKHLDHQTQHPCEQRRHGQRPPEAQARLQRVREVGRQRHERALGEIDGVVQPEDERQAERQQRIKRSGDQAVERIEDKDEIQGNASAAADGQAADSRSGGSAGTRSGASGARKHAAGFRRRQRDLLARHDARNVEQVRILARLNHMPREHAQHQLVILRTVEHIAGLKRDLRGQHQALHRLDDLGRFERLGLFHRQPDGMRGGKTKPCARRRVFTFVGCGVTLDEIRHMRSVRLVPVPLHGPPAVAGRLGQRLRLLQLEQSAAHGDVFVDAELRDLLHAVDLIVTGQQQAQHVGRLGFHVDQIGRKIGRPHGHQRTAHHGASRLLELCGVVGLLRLTKGVVSGQEVPLLAEFLVERLEVTGRQHPGGRAGAEGRGLALLAGQAVDVAAGTDEELVVAIGKLRHGERGRRVDRAHEEVHLVLAQQTRGLVHRSAGIACAVFHEDLQRTAHHASRLVDLGFSEFGALDFALPERCKGAGDGIDQPDFHRRLTSAPARHLRAQQSGQTRSAARLDQRATIHLNLLIRVFLVHACLLLCQRTEMTLFVN